VSSAFLDPKFELHVSPQIDWVFNDGHLSVSSVRTNIDGLLLHGPTGSVKTSIAVHIAKNSDFPFVKMISPETMIGMLSNPELMKLQTFSIMHTSQNSV
jgi:vesicle-fusing ATPase